MAYYIKVAKKVAEKIGAPVENRNITSDGNILLWQADLNIIPGETIFDRAAFVGGVAMMAVQAKAEIVGTSDPAEVTIPEYYQDPEPEVPETELPEEPADGSDPQPDETDSVQDHPVTLPAGTENGEHVEPNTESL